jgi:hypothetical protein
MIINKSRIPLLSIRSILVRVLLHVHVFIYVIIIKFHLNFRLSYLGFLFFTFKKMFGFVFKHIFYHSLFWFLYTLDFFCLCSFYAYDIERGKVQEKLFLYVVDFLIKKRDYNFYFKIFPIGVETRKL